MNHLTKAFAGLCIIASAALSGCASQPAYDLSQTTGTTLSNYKSFSVKPVMVDNINADAMIRVGKAIRYAMAQRDIIYQEDGGELLIEYGVGIRRLPTMELQPITVGNQTYMRHREQTDNIGTLVMGLFEADEEKKVIAIVSGSKKVDGTLKLQDDLNRQFLEIIQDIQ